MYNLHLKETFPNPFFHLDLTKVDRTLLLHEEPLELDQVFKFNQDSQDEEKDLHEDRIFHLKLLQLLEDNQRDQYSISKHLRFHIFNSIHHKIHKPV